MGHAHNNTLLSRMGFQDPDIRLPRHELACRYLTTPENLPKIAPVSLYQKDIERGVSWAKECGEESPVFSVGCAFEFPLSKGERQYKTTIGFMDVACVLLKNSHTVWFDTPSRLGILCALEVKITPCTASEILRQINLQREYVFARRWVVVTEFRLSAPEIDVLRDGRISYYMLGEGFEEYKLCQEAIRLPDITPTI